MDDAARPAATLSGAKVIQAIKDAGIDYILSVPDLHTSKGLLAPIAKDPDLKLIRVGKEDECIGISAGLRYGDILSLMLVQFTGFLFAMNAIRGVVLEQKQPLPIMVGLLGKEPGVAPQKSKRLGVQLMEPILDVLGIKRVLIETDEDVHLIRPTIEECFEKKAPVVILIGGKPL